MCGQSTFLFLKCPHLCHTFVKNNIYISVLNDSSDHIGGFSKCEHKIGKNKTTVVNKNRKKRNCDTQVFLIDKQYAEDLYGSEVSDELAPLWHSVNSKCEKMMQAENVNIFHHWCVQSEVTFWF